MEILDTNFSEKLPEIVECIRKANFVALDQEFTGLFRDSTFGQPYASVQSHYSKMAKLFDGFIVIQLGISAFWVDPEDETKFQCRTFNIYLYPRGRRSTFRFEGSCIDFLVSNGFDFNKLFLNGVSYCSIQDAEKMKAQLQQRHAEMAEQMARNEADLTSHIPVPNGEKETIDKACEEIDKFLASDDEELILDSYNGFQRKLIYQAIEEKFFGKVTASPKEMEKNRKAMAITRKKSREEEKKIFEEKCEQEMKNLDAQIGVTHIFNALAESKVLIICHNMFLDLMYFMRQFTGPLPDDLNEYKKLVHDHFPSILDTKYLCSGETLKPHVNSTVLPHLLETCRNEPFGMPKVECIGEEKYSVECEKEHEAGYDAFITGICFISLATFLKIPPKELNGNCKKLKSFKNKIFLMGLEDISCINLTGPDGKPSRQHVFHTTFPSTWKSGDIVRHFRNFGQIHIKWISEGSAFVALQQREYAASVMKKIGRTPGVTVMPYTEYEAIQSPAVDAAKKRKASQEEAEKSSAKKPRPLSKRFDESSDW
ncbi:poly(A)-specific ribonuclease PARN-like [Lutzomyia longipalpis]|uniref:poly(A)-specific ribonuclease PARN-like n=1 Tax=Lutzomyia longipalpis TaxID=7200 RepID=UPI002484423C|nr:poly(A)-specific ribonuclease PARN-like [Lutzomyia longipalpis]